MIRRCCLIHLKNSWTCQQQRYNWVCVCGQGKIVGKEHQLLAGFRVGHLDSAEFVRIVLGGVEAGEDDGLVALEAGLFVDGSGIEAAVAPILYLRT